MANERRQIRDGIKAIIEGLYPGHVETNLYIDARERDDYCHVYLSAGRVTAEGMDQRTVAQLTVGYYTKTRNDDDGIDAVMDPIVEALNAPRVLDFVRGVSPVGFEYVSEQESEFSGLEWEFTVTF